MSEQTRPKERVVELKVASLANREAADALAQVDPVSGMIWPNGSHLWPSVDLAPEDHRIAMGLTIDQQCTVITERCAAMRSNNPHWAPGRFKYFTGAMHDLLAAISSPVPGATSKSEQSNRDAKMNRYEKMGRK